MYKDLREWQSDATSVEEDEGLFERPELYEV